MPLLTSKALGWLMVLGIFAAAAVFVYFDLRKMKHDNAVQHEKDMAYPFYRRNEYIKEAKQKHPEVPWDKADFFISPAIGARSDDEHLAYRYPGSQAYAVYYPSDGDFFYTDGKDRFDTADEAIRSYFKKNPPRS